jgi:hypothetical protein
MSLVGFGVAFIVLGLAVLLAPMARRRTRRLQ